MNEHITSIRSYVMVFAALLVLLFATVGAAHLPLGPLHLPVAMAIATAKAVLIVLIFMHAIHSNRFTFVVCIAAFLWLAIMVGLTLTDYQSRPWLDVPGK